MSRFEEILNPFNKWYDAQFNGEWHKDSHTELLHLWADLHDLEIKEHDIKRVFDTLVSAITNQYE